MIERRPANALIQRHFGMVVVQPNKATGCEPLLRTVVLIVCAHWLACENSGIHVGSGRCLAAVCSVCKEKRAADKDGMKMGKGLKYTVITAKSEAPFRYGGHSELFIWLNLTPLARESGSLMSYSR